MLDLNLVGVPGTSIWSRLDAGHLDFGNWIWMPSDWATNADAAYLDKLRSDGWERVNTDNDMQTVWMLSGQFARTQLLSVSGEAERQVWARKSDIERVQSLPVALGFSLALAEAADPTDAQGKPLIAVQYQEYLPPPIWGNLAYIRDPESGGYWFYPAKALGEIGIETQEAIGDLFANIVGGENWTIFDPAFHLTMLQGTYFQQLGKLENDVRAKAIFPAERTQAEQRLEAFKAKHEQYMRWQARNQKREEMGQRWLDIWEGVHELVIKLAEMYWQHHQAQPRQEQTSAMPPRQKAPYVQDAVKHADDSGKGLLYVPTSLPIQGALAATQAPPAWKGAPGSIERYYDFTPGRKGDFVQTSLVPPKGNTLAPDQILQEISGMLDRMGGLDGDVIIAIIAQALVSRHLLQDGSFWITPEAILNYRGVQPNTKDDGLALRTAGYQTTQRQAIIGAVERVMYLFVKVRQTVKGRKRPIETQSHLFLELERQVQPPMFPEDREKLVAWRIKPGTWFDEYDVGMSSHFGWLMQQILSYNPSTQAWEKYLGRYFTFHLRIAAGSGQKTIERTARTLITSSGLGIDARHPQRTRDNLERALDTLERDRVIDAWAYEATGSHKPPEPKAKGWLDAWLDMPLRITCAARSLEHGNQQAIDTVEAMRATQATLDAALQNGDMRKRGRPRKNPIPSTKRPRGRPRKQ